MSAAKKMRTPWGGADSIEKVTPSGSILKVGTPGHGGYKLDRFTNSRVNAAWRKAGGWYEEDAEWAIVALTFQHDAGFSADNVANAHATAKKCYPDEYTEVYGVPVTPEESPVLRMRLARAAAVGKLHMTCAWGEWATNVPPGFVGVHARLDGTTTPEDPSGDRYFLVSREEYDARGEILVVDPARHREILSPGLLPFASKPLAAYKVKA